MFKTLIALSGLALGVGASTSAVASHDAHPSVCCSMPCCEECQGPATCCCGGSCCN